LKARSADLTATRARRQSKVQQLDPRGGVIAGFCQLPGCPVDTGCGQAFAGDRVQQEVIDPQSGVAFERTAKIVPKCVDSLIGIDFAYAVDPALGDQIRESLTHFRDEQSVLYPTLGFVNVEVRRNDVVVPGQDHGSVNSDEPSGMGLQPIEPCELVIELGTGPRVAIGRVETTDEHAIHGSFDIATVGIACAPGEAAPGFLRLALARQDGDAVPALLPEPNGAVASVTDGAFGEFLIGGLQFLEAGDVGFGLPQPFEQHRKPTVDPVHIVSGDTHRRLIVPMALWFRRAR